MDIRLFKQDIAHTLEQYPKLSFHNNGQYPYLTGIIEIYDGETILEEFNVSIFFSDKYPFEYPKVYEIRGRFPRNPIFHIYKTGNFCLDTPVNEFFKTRNGILTIDFINKVLIPNLAWRICKLENIETDLKDFSHGFEGIIETYQELLKTQDLNEILKCFQITLSKSNLIPERNNDCFCKSGKKFKNCHSTKIHLLSLLPEHFLKNHFEELLKYLNKNPQ
jgi:ubiquitin-protein ligase